MANKTTTQSDKFKEAARELGADDKNARRFNDALRKIAPAQDAEDKSEKDKADHSDG